MTQAPLYNQEGANVGEIELPKQVFDVKILPELIHQAVQTQIANARASIAHTKGRGEVRGGGKKPWKQKGTGRARHASRRSPIWKGGGVAFGPTKDRNFTKEINKKMARKALCMALTSKNRDHELLILDDLKLADAKTKQAVAVIRALSTHLEGFKSSKKKHDSILLVTSDKNRSIEQATKNLARVETISAPNMNIRAVLERKYLIVVRDALEVLKKTLSKKAK